MSGAPKLELPPFETLCTQWKRRDAATLNAPAERSLRPQHPAGSTTEDGALDFARRALLGRGGMGEVYRVPQPLLERDVAVKTLRGEAEEASLAAFLGEAVATSRMRHPNVVPVHALGRRPDGSLFLSMQLVRGQTWQRLLEERPDDLDRHLDVLTQVCQAVAYAQSQSIAHNDIKPANVMLGDFGEVYLLDWGLAVSYGPPAEGSRMLAAASIEGPLGTPAYMAPELAMGNGAAIGTWTDVYLLGAVLFHILAGRAPHVREGGLARHSLLHIASGQLPELPPEAPAELADICRRALTANPLGRQPDAARLLTELRDFRRHRDSLRLAATARARLTAGRHAEAERDAYDGFARSIAGFAAAIELWDANPSACRGLAEAREAYADRALREGDLGLAASQLGQLGDAAPAALGGRLVAARRRLERRARTRRWLQAGLAAAVVVILVGFAVGYWSIDSRNRQLREERDRVAERGAIAEDALRALSDRIPGLLVDELGSPDAFLAAHEALAEAARGWERLQASDDFATRGALGRAQAQLTLGLLRQALGQYAACRAALRTAAALLAADESPAAIALRAAIHAELATELVWTDVDEASAAAQEALRLVSLLPDGPAPLRAQVHAAVARTLLAEERQAAALPLLDEAVALWRTSTAPAELASALLARGRLRSATGQGAARADLEECVALRRALHAAGPSSLKARRQLAVALAELGVTTRDVTQQREAAELFGGLLERRMFPELAHDLAQGLGLLQSAQQLAKAAWLPLLERALEAVEAEDSRRLAGAHALLLRNVGSQAGLEGHRKKSRALLERALAIEQRIGSPLRRAKTLRMLARVQGGRPAQESLEEGLRLLRTAEYPGLEARAQEARLLMDLGARRRRTDPELAASREIFAELLQVADTAPHFADHARARGLFAFALGHERGWPAAVEAYDALLAEVAPRLHADRRERLLLALEQDACQALFLAADPRCLERFRALVERLDAHFLDDPCLELRDRLAFCLSAVAQLEGSVTERRAAAERNLALRREVHSADSANLVFLMRKVVAQDLCGRQWEPTDERALELAAEVHPEALHLQASGNRHAMVQAALAWSSLCIGLAWREHDLAHARNFLEVAAQRCQALVQLEKPPPHVSGVLERVEAALDGLPDP